MVIRLGVKNIKKQQQLVDVRETFNLWDILKSKYDIAEFLSVNYRFAHDLDLKAYITDYLQDIEKNIKILERLLTKYSIQGPSQGRISVNWAGNSEPTRDEMIALQMMIYIQEHIENLLRATRTSVTNDSIRLTLTRILKRSIKNSDRIYKYLKMKGWIETPPIYPNTAPDQIEKISCASVAHLWDHLTYRYDTIRRTKTYLALIKDGDFKILLERGIAELNAQVNILEDQCRKFGITPPKRPPKVIVTPENSEIFTDDQIYRAILEGLQSAGMMHAEALKQCTTNDSIRQLFQSMLLGEIDFYHNFIKYGKVKGWLHPVPAYRA